MPRTEPMVTPITTESVEQAVAHLLVFRDQVLAAIKATTPHGTVSLHTAPFTLGDVYALACKIEEQRQQAIQRANLDPFRVAAPPGNVPGSFSLLPFHINEAYLSALADRLATGPALLESLIKAILARTDQNVMPAA